MASPALLREQRALLDPLDALRTRDTVALFRAVDPFDAPGATEALLRELPLVLGRYATVNAELMADWYDEARFEARARGRFRATPLAGFGADDVETMVRGAVSPLWAADPDPRRALVNLNGGARRLVFGSARETLLGNSKRDPARPRFARVVDPLACDFCLMIASRGAVFSDQVAHFEAHDHCKCSATPVFSGQQAPDMNLQLQDEWQNVTQGASGDDARSLWRAHVAQTRAAV